MKIYHTSGLTLHPGIHFTVIKGCKKMKTHLAVFFAKNFYLISKYHTLVDFNLEFGMQLEILAHLPQNNAIYLMWTLTNILTIEAGFSDLETGFFTNKMAI